MAFTFDVYLLGPAPGVTREQLLEGLTRIFGALPDAFLQALGAGGPLKVKTAVDLDVAQRFVDGIKAVGGLVEMVRAGASAPGQALPASGSGQHVAGYVAGRGQRIRHRSIAERPTGAQLPVGAPTPTPPPVEPPVTARPAFHPGLAQPALRDDTNVDYPPGDGYPPGDRASTGQFPATGQMPASGEPWAGGTGRSPAPPSGQFPSVGTGQFPSVGTGQFPSVGTGKFPAAGDEEAEAPPPPLLEVPQILVSLEPVHPNHPLRGPEHLAALHPLTNLAQVAAPYDKRLSLGVLGAAELDKMVGEYIAKQLHLVEPVELYFTEPHEGEVKGVTGVVITARSVAWRDAKIPLSRLDTVAVQCGVDERPYVEIGAAGEIFPLPPLAAVTTVILAETLARVSPRRQLWVGPRAVRRLRPELARALGRFTRTALSRDDEAHPARRAIGMVRYYYDMVMRLHAHWEQYPVSRWGVARQIPMGEIINTVIAPEFLEIRDRLAPQTDGMVKEMLTGAQNILQHDEGVLALFEFRDPRWTPRPDLDAISAGSFFLLNYGLPSRETVRKATRENYLLGTHGVLTNRRLVFVRPGGASAASEISLGKIEDIAVQDGPAPRLHIKFLGSFDQRQTLRYACSGNYLYPVAGSPLEQVQRLAGRVVEAQERFWESQQPALSEAAKLPPPPVWLGEALAQTPRVKLDRLLAACLALMRDPATPREARRLAAVGQGIQLTALRALREKAATARLPLSGLGERVLYLPGELFDRDDDGIFVTEEGLLVSGFGIGRVGWHEVRRIETINDGSWTAALIGGAREDVGIRSKNEELIIWLGTLVSTLVYAADVQ